MKMSEFTEEIEEITNAICPGLKMYFCTDRGCPDTLVGIMEPSFVLDNALFMCDEKWIQTSPGNRMHLVKYEVIKMLCKMKEKLDKHIERIENGST